MRGAEAIAKLFLFAVPVGFGLIIVILFLRKRINWRGIVSDETGANSPARWQLLVVSLAAALTYLAQVATQPNLTVLPELPGWFTSAMLASNAVYLMGKGGVLATLASAFSNLRSIGRI